MAPAAVLWNGRIHLFWHSNRDKGWQIWQRVHNGAGWQEAAVVTAHWAEDKEAVALADGTNQLRLLWRSQRGGVRYQSRTVDTGDNGMLDHLRTYQDRAHYTFDTGLENVDWYAPDTVGLYLRPDTIDPIILANQVNRVQHFMEPFRPLPVRFVWILDIAIDEEIIDTGNIISEEITDEMIEP
jgi:hypothetical protein